MTILTIPKNLIKNDDLVIIPRKEYERVLRIIKKETAQDWIYKEPFFSELKKRIVIAEKELKRKKISAWRKL